MLVGQCESAATTCGTTCGTAGAHYTRVTRKRKRAGRGKRDRSENRSGNTKLMWDTSIIESCVRVGH